jgi:glycosyltransferase involved in cell wall biosynthesis
VLRRIRRPWELHIVSRDYVDSGDSDERVRVHGEVENKSAAFAALLASSDIFALPTLADCYSIASLDAMAAGLPVITTAVGGIDDIVIDGETGYLIPPGDATALRQRLETLMTDAALRCRMGDAGRRRVEEHFDARKSAATVHRVIRAVGGASTGMPRTLANIGSSQRSPFGRQLPDAEPAAGSAIPGPAGRVAAAWRARDLLPGRDHRG